MVLTLRFSAAQRYPTDKEPLEQDEHDDHRQNDQTGCGHQKIEQDSVLGLKEF